MSTPATSVRVVQRFAAPPARVFDAWLDPVWIGKWMFGPALRDEEVLRIEVDPRVGGAFSFVVRRQGRELDHLGRYLEIDRPRRLVFTWGVDSAEAADRSRVEIDIAPLSAGCELTLVHHLHPDWLAYAERTQAGWTKMVGVLAVQLDGPPAAA